MESNKYYIKDGYALCKKSPSIKEIISRVRYETKYTKKYNPKSIYKLILK